METLAGPVEDLSDFGMDSSGVTSFPVIFMTGTDTLGGEADCDGLLSAFFWFVSGGSVLRTCK